MAYDIGYDIITYDDNIEELIAGISAKSELFEESINEFDSILKNMIENNCLSKKLNIRLTDLSEYVQSLKGIADNISKTTDENKKNFMSDMDTADSCIF